LHRDSLRRVWFGAGVAAAGVLLWCAPVAARPIDRAQILVPSHSIGRVEAQLDDGRVGVGSAITVARGILVTNCHVTSKAVSIKVVGLGMSWAVTQQAAHPVHDVCFLRVPDWPQPPVLLRGASPLHLGDAVSAMGYTAAAMSLRSGTITGLHAHDGAQIIETDTAFTSGASGGGLFDDEGALIGMLTFRMRGSAGHYFALPMTWIRDRLPRENQWRDIAPLRSARPFWAGEIDQLPLFMRAASLEQQQRWNDLRAVAEFWSAHDPENADAYLALGVALSRLAVHEAAIDSLARAVALAPGNAQAWFNLGEAYRANGNWGPLRRVAERLAQLDGPLAERLRAEMERSLTVDVNP
jgi:Trypsin-like peptidase domain/Tetratricopeptide repeat